MDDRPPLNVRKPWLPVLVTLLLTAGLGGWVGWLWQTQEQRVRQEQEAHFSFEVDYIEHRLRERMQVYEVVLRGLAGLIAARDRVSPEDWRSATDQLCLQDIYPGIQAVSLAWYAKRHQLPTLLSSISRDRPDFQVYPEGLRDAYMVVEYTHPQIWRNRQALGFDLLSEPLRHEAIDYARDAGFPVMTGPLQLQQDAEDTSQHGVLLFLPLYQAAKSIASPEQRQKAFLGVLCGAFRLDDLLGSILQARRSLFRLQIVDFANPAEPLLSEAAGTMTKAVYQETRHIHLYGRNWQLSVSSTPHYEMIIVSGHQTLNWVANMLSVLLFSMLVGGYLYTRERMWINSQAMNEQLQEREQRFRLLIETLPVATLVADEHGCIELANRSAAQLLNADRAQMVGSSVHRYLPNVLTGQPFTSDTEILAQQANGQALPVTLHLTRFSQIDGLRYVLNLIDLRAFKRAKERFRDVVEGLPNAFVLANAQGKIVAINRQTEILFGYSRQDLLGSPLERLLPEATLCNHQDLCHTFEKHPEPFRIGRNREVFGRHHDGHMLPLEVGLAPLHDADELWVQCVLIDISHRKNAELRLRDQADQLATVNRYKSEFLANMSHELRTPLNSILILSDQLRENRLGNLQDKQIRHAEIIHRAGTDLLQLINDVLDLSRIEVGRLQLDLDTFNISELLDELTASLQPIAEQQGLTLAYAIEPDTPLQMVSDRRRVQQVLRNLISNALKFTERGTVKIIARCVVSAANPELKRLQLMVNDTGIGIPEHEFKRIFQAFQQIDGSISRRYGGTGLGLAISRQLVEVLQGSLSVESVLEQGSTFTIELPLAISSPEEEAEQFLTSRGKYLLIISQNMSVAREAMEVGHIYGFDSIHCRKGQDAQDMLQEHRFAAVLLDLQLADMNGWQCYRQLRSDEQHHTVPIVVLSNIPQLQEWPDNALRCLVKPVTRLDLQRIFIQWLRCENHPNRLLLISAESRHSKRLTEYFERLGYDVTQVSRSDDARLNFAEQRFKALVIDYDLPEADGLDLLEALNRLRPLNTKEIHVMVYSHTTLSERDLQRLHTLDAVYVSREAPYEVLSAALGGTSTQAEPVGTPALDSHLWQGRKALLVDSNVKNIFILSGLLDELGIQTTPAITVEEALSHFRWAAYDFVLVANVGEAGVLIHRLRDGYGCQVPILGVDAANREALLAAGVDDALNGPLAREGLAHLIQSGAHARA